MDDFLKWIHKAMLIRRIILIWALWMSTWISVEVWEWIKELDKLDMAVSTIAGAVLTPILGLTGWIIKNYAQHPYSDKHPEDKEGEH